jgi:TatD DNase family protein
MPLIDTHCHIDLYQNPHSIAEESERLGIITIGMTLLPSHFEMGYKHTAKYKQVRLALGMHPLKSELHEDEFDNFIYYSDKTSYIGEIGLDFSKEGIKTKQLQINSFKKILFSIKSKRKIISLHSRRAEKDVLRLLVEYGIENAIFHWYTGSINLIKEIIENGYYFSINPAMIRSANGEKIIQAIPKHRVLTESDGPFVLIKNEPIRPKDIISVIEYLSVLWGISVEKVKEQIDNNFSLLVEQIKPNN